MEQFDPIEALKLIRGLAFAASGSHEVGYLKTTVRDVLVIVHKALPPRTARPNKILPVSARHPTAHIFSRSNRAVRAMPENRPRCASIKTAAMRIRIGTGLVEGRGGVGTNFARL